MMYIYVLSYIGGNQYLFCMYIRKTGQCDRFFIEENTKLKNFRISQIKTPPSQEHQGKEICSHWAVLVGSNQVIK